MGRRVRRGCGCAIAVLLAVIIAAGIIGWKYVLPWWKKQPPPASGGELVIRILDVGPIEGDSILISSPAGRTHFAAPTAHRIHLCQTLRQ